MFNDHQSINKHYLNHLMVKVIGKDEGYGSSLGFTKHDRNKLSSTINSDITLFCLVQEV